MTHTKIVKEMLKGCGKQFEKLEYSKGIFKTRKDFIFEVCKKEDLCPICKARFLEREDAIKSELELLEKIKKAHEGMDLTMDVFDGIKDCKNALKLIEEKI